MRLSAAGAKEDARANAHRSSCASITGQGYGRRSSLAATASVPGSPARRKSISSAIPEGNTLSDSVNLEVLRHLESVFRSADTSGNGELDMEEFVAAFKGVISTPEGSDDEALRKLFMRIDANCDATVDWNEFSAYLLLEKTNSGAAIAAGSGLAAAGSTANAGMSYSTVEPPVLPAGVAHRELISGLMHVDTGNGPDKWYSTGKDGTVRVWNGKDLAHLRTLQTPLQCITAASCLPSSGLLALGSYSPCVLLIDPASGDQAGKLPSAASSATTSLAGLQKGGVVGGGSGRELLAIGDADGAITLMEVVVDEVADKKSVNRYQGKQLWRTTNHHDWVVGVVPLPQLSALLAASLDKRLTMTDLERRIAVKTLTGHDKSVTCCTWSGVYKMAVSGGADRQLILWNPFSCRPLGSLSGHVAPLVAVALNERQHQVVSAAADKTIKVWDLRNQRCLQTFQDRTMHHPEDTLSALAYSPSRKLLVSGAYSLRPWPLTDGRAGAAYGHRDPVSWVGYNPMFHEAVSTDHAGNVCVWHVPSGRLRSSFGNTHGGCRISAATFDSNHRRLITGAEDGSVKVWNFSSGALLSTLAAPDCCHDWGGGSGVEVTGLAVSGSNHARNIIVAGWDRKVTWYDDTGRRSSPLLRCSTGPTSDVLAAALMQGHPTLATACYDGEIWLWNLESGAVRRKLLPPGHALLPENEQPVERLAFMSGALRQMLVAVGADRMLRCWDCFSGACLLEHFTGHQQGESVAALALAPDNSTAVTADTAGYIMVWDLSGIRSLSASKTGPGMFIASRLSSAAAAAAVAAAAADARAAGTSSGSICRIAVWRGHQDAITALDWIPAPTPAAAAAAAASNRLSAPGAVLDSANTGAPTGQETDGNGTYRSRSPQQQAAAQGMASKQQLHALVKQHQHLHQVQQTDQHCSQGEQARPGTQQHHPCPGESPDDGGSLKHLGYVVSASLDNTLSLWTTAGALVGMFGRHSWSLDAADTWQSKERAALKPEEEFDMLVSSKPLSPSAEQTKPQLSQQPRPSTARPQLQAAQAATGISQQQHSSRPQSAAAGNGIPQPGSAGDKEASAIASSVPTPVMPSGRLASPGSASASGSSSSNRSVSGSRTSRSRQASGTGSMPSLLQHTNLVSAGSRHSSRPSSAVRHLSSSQQLPGSQAGAGAGVEAAACGEATTQESIALVCQTSMRQREHSLQTLSSLNRQGSSNSTAVAPEAQLSWRAAGPAAKAGQDGCQAGSLPDAEDSTSAFIVEDSSVEELPFTAADAGSTVAGGMLQSSQHAQHQQVDGHAAVTQQPPAAAWAVPGNNTTAASSSASSSAGAKHRPPSAVQHHPRTRASRVGFAGVVQLPDGGQGPSQLSNSTEGQQPVAAGGLASDQAAAGQSAGEEVAPTGAGAVEPAGPQAVQLGVVGDQDAYDEVSEPAVAEDDIPSSLWLPQFGHKPAANVLAQQLIQAGQRVGSSRPGSAAAALGIRPGMAGGRLSMLEGTGQGAAANNRGKIRPFSAAPNLR